MAEPRTYPHGVTSLDRHRAARPEAAAGFYGGLFGWTFTDACRPAPRGRTSSPRSTARTSRAIAPGAAAARLEHLRRRRRRRRHRGGRRSPAAAPSISAPGGRRARRPGRHLRRPGRRRVPAVAGRAAGWARSAINAPGAWNFSDLHTPDREAAMAFYTPCSAGGPPTSSRGRDDAAGARVRRPPRRHRRPRHPRAAGLGAARVRRRDRRPRRDRPGETAHWHVTFTVADRDDSAAAAERLGATSSRHPTTSGPGTRSVRDPQGAEFTVSQFTPPDGDW